jgi:cobalt-zinc-cadmium efflux system protein
MYVLRGEYFHAHNENKTTPDKKHKRVDNIDASKILHSSDKKRVTEGEDLNIQGAKLELLSDTIGSVGVILGGILIAMTDMIMIDPILSIGLSLFIVPRIFNLLKKSVHILMEGVPSNVSYELIQQELLQVKGVTGVFDLHIWSITSGLHALSAHIVIMDTSNSYRILDDINSLLEKKFQINHSTIQIERFHPTGNSE